MRRAISPKQVTWLMSAALAAGAVVLTTPTAGGGPILALHLPVVVVAVALGAGFFFAEQFLVNVEFRRQAHTFTLAGIPLLIGVLVLPPIVFVLTRLVASVLALVWQRVSVDKMAYNSAAYVFEAAADAILVHLLLNPARGLDLQTAASLIVLLALVDQFIGALVLVMIRIHNGPLSRADVLDVLAPGLVLSVTASMFAFSMILLFEYGTLGVVVAAMLLVIFATGYRAYAAARHRHQLLTMVHEFVTGGVGAQSLETLAEELLSRIRRLLRASTVQVMIVDSDCDSDGDRGDRFPSQVGSALTLAVDEQDSLDVSHQNFDTQDWVVVRTLTQQEPLATTPPMTHLPVWPTGGDCTPTRRHDWPRRPAGAERYCCWTWTSSKRSTTAWATTPGTSSWSRWVPGCAGRYAARTCWHAWAVTSSPSCSRTQATRRRRVSQRTCVRRWPSPSRPWPGHPRWGE